MDALANYGDSDDDHSQQENEEEVESGSESDQESNSEEASNTAASASSSSASTSTKRLPSALDVLSNVEKPKFLTIGQPTALEKKYFNLEYNPDAEKLASSSSSKAGANMISSLISSSAQSNVTTAAKELALLSSSNSSSASASSPYALLGKSIDSDKKPLTTRQRNKLQEERGQAVFTLKDGRDMPDLWRPDQSSSSSSSHGNSNSNNSTKGNRVGNKRPVDIMRDGISNATATRDSRARASQQRKVSSGQSFEGRTWKTEQEMVLRQQYD